MSNKSLVSPSPCHHRQRRTPAAAPRGAAQRGPTLVPRSGACLCFHCRHTPGCWLKGFSYNNHQIPLLGCKPQTWAFPRCTALRGAVLLAASHMLESNWISPPPGPAQCFKSPVCPQISFPLVCEVSPRFQSHPHVLHTPARDRFRDSQHRPCAEAAGSPRAGDQAALPALAPHSPGATAPSPPGAWAEGAVLVAAPCLVKSPQTVPWALGAGC